MLGCSDARVPIELIFNEGPNDLFVVRVAGNGLGGEVLGSLKYAVEHLGGSLKLIVVLGHSGCGAVSAAVDVFLKPEAYLDARGQAHLRGILDRLLVVVHAAAKRMAAVHGTGSHAAAEATAPRWSKPRSSRTPRWQPTRCSSISAAAIRTACARPTAST